MREILFRGKAINRIKGREYRTNLKNGDWVYGLVSKMYDERFELLPAEMTNTDGISGIDVDYRTVGQYTGLTDKNGEKIFEWDIVRAFRPPQTENNVIGVVVFEYGTFKIKPLYHHKDKEFMWIADLTKERSTQTAFAIENNFILRGYVLEVVGNIFDNPELLKGEE